MADVGVPRKNAYGDTGRDWTGEATGFRTARPAQHGTPGNAVVSAGCSRSAEKTDSCREGDRGFEIRDPEGHVWTFGQTVRHVSREEAEKESGLKIEGWH